MNVTVVFRKDTPLKRSRDFLWGDDCHGGFSKSLSVSFPLVIRALLDSPAKRTGGDTIEVITIPAGVPVLPDSGGMETCGVDM